MAVKVPSAVEAAAPDGAEVVALEGGAELADVHGGEAGKRDGQVEAQGHVAVALVAEAVQLPLHLGVGVHFADEDFGVLKRRRVDGRKAVGAVHLPGLVHEPLARDHQFRRVVAEALQEAGSDELRHKHL